MNSTQKLIPYVVDAATGRVRVPVRIERACGMRIRTHEDLGKAVGILLEKAVRGRIGTLAVNARRKLDRQGRQ